MNMLRMLIPGIAVSACLLFSGCQMMSGSSPASSLGRLSPFDGPPRQSEPEILDEKAESLEQKLNSDKLSKQAPGKQDRKIALGESGERGAQLSLPVTESRPALTDDQVQYPGISEEG